MKMEESIFCYSRDQLLSIDGIGPKICGWIEELRPLVGTHQLQKLTPIESKETTGNMTDTPEKHTRRQKKKKIKIPGVRTGGWAILIYMYKCFMQSGQTKFTKSDLLNGQEYCDASMTVDRGYGQEYDALHARFRLIDYQYIKDESNGVYVLTAIGKRVAAFVYAVERHETPPRLPPFDQFHKVMIPRYPSFSLFVSLSLSFLVDPGGSWMDRRG